MKVELSLNYSEEHDMPDGTHASSLLSDFLESVYNGIESGRIDRNNVNVDVAEADNERR